jgi:hypothetical protein
MSPVQHSSYLEMGENAEGDDVQHSVIATRDETNLA